MDVREDTDVGAKGTTMRFLTWNIQSGGGKRVPRIVDEIDRLRPDVVGLTEVTLANLELLRRSLAERGFEHSATTRAAGNRNSVLIASRTPIRIVDDRIGHDQERWLAIELVDPQINVLCVHIPGGTDNKFDADGIGLSGKKRKEMLWNEVIRYAKQHRDEPTVILGDFNTGLPEDAQGMPFILSDYIRVLKLEKYVDTWRRLNPRSREFTWFTKRKNIETGESADYNGFRLDYIFVSPALDEHIVGARHVHDARITKVSDHAMVVADLMVDQSGNEQVNTVLGQHVSTVSDHGTGGSLAASQLSPRPQDLSDSTSDSLLSALTQTRNPTNNHAFIRRFTAELGITEFRAVVKPDKSYAVGKRHNDLPDLHIYYGYTTGFISEDEIIRAAGTSAGRAPSSRKGTWYVKHPTNHVRPSGRR